MYSYSAYGLNIHSALLLPELVAGEGKVDVIIRFGKVGGLPAKINNTRMHIHAIPGGVSLSWHDVGAFLVRNGREIIVDPAPGVEERVLRLFVLGPALGVLLHRRGLLVFHASVIASLSSAVAFLAQKGCGKSTTAAILHARGHDLVADDIMALDDEGDCLMVRPGFPQLKLWPDSVEAIGGIPESLPLLYPTLEKRAFSVAQGFALKPIPLSCAFVLGVGQDLEIVPLQPKEALLSVMPHWYGALFRGELLPVLGLETHFRECVSLVKKIPIYVLKRPASLAALPDVARLVEEHIARDV